jgi:hypothetical protein
MADRSLEQSRTDGLDERLQGSEFRGLDGDLVALLIEHHDDGQFWRKHMQSFQKSETTCFRNQKVRQNDIEKSTFQTLESFVTATRLGHFKSGVSKRTTVGRQNRRLIVDQKNAASWHGHHLWEPF